jgi:histidyl-tRNA synthetase
MPLSTKPYRGARDFYPEEKRLQKYMFAKWREAVESYGYEEYDAPILEPLEIYLAKTGEEIVNEQTYVFEDRGQRKVVIRPEMTPTVSRMVAAKRQELAYPLRWYSIPNLWRYERPQRGRLREHWQLNVDIFGVSDMSAEIEMICLVDSIFKVFGATSKMYEIKLNHRALVDYLLSDYLGFKPDTRHKISKLIDRMHKMEKSEFISKVDEILSPKEKQEAKTEKLLAILEAKDISKLPDPVKSQKAYEEVDTVLNQLKGLGISQVSYDPTIMRGFDYYTGIVFEAYDRDPTNNRSMMGGGRYDGLVGLFGVAPVPTVGFGWGDVTLTNFLEVHHLLPELKPESDLYVAILGDDIKLEAQKIVSKLRSQGIKVSVDLSNKKLGDQIKTANKKAIDKLLIIGEKEIKSSSYTLKDLAAKTEETLTLDDLKNKLSNSNK